MIKKTIINILLLFITAITLSYSQILKIKPTQETQPKETSIEQSITSQSQETQTLQEPKEQKKEKEVIKYEVLETIDDFESGRYSRTYWWGSGPDAQVSVKSASDTGQIGRYAMKIEYTFYTGDWNRNWISISRSFSPATNFSEADGISLLVKGSGSEGVFVVALKDKNGMSLEYDVPTVLQNSCWSKIVIPFNLFSIKNKITLRGTKSFDFSNITDLEFYISLPDRTKREVPISGICFIDQVELVKGIKTLSKPIFSKVPDGYLYTEYYSDTESGNGFYQTLVLNDTLYLSDKISLYWNIKLPSKYVISGFAPERKIDWVRGDDIKLVNNKKYSITISELYVKFSKPYKYIENISLGTSFVQWNPWVLYGQSKNPGIVITGQIASAGNYETFIGGDYWKRILLIANKFTKETKTTYLSPMFATGRQYAKDLINNQTVPVIDFSAVGIELRKNIDLSKIKLYDSRIFITAANITETTYGFWRKDNAWNPSFSYEENLSRVNQGGVLLEKLFDKPAVLTDNAVILSLMSDRIGNSKFSTKIEYRYIGTTYGGVLAKDTLLPWMIEDKPPTTLYAEQKLDSTILAQKYSHLPAGYLDTGYVDQTGTNLALYYNWGDFPFSGWIQLDLSQRVSRPSIGTNKYEGGISYNKQNQIIGLDALVGLNSVHDKREEKNKITYYELDLRVKPFSKFNLSVVGGYRIEEHSIFENITKNIYFVQILSKPLPNLILDFKIKQTNPDKEELGGTVATVREGDYKIWADHMPDNYMYLQLKFFF